MNKKFEYVDDNPGAYFGMLVESVEDKEDKKNLRNWIEKRVGKQMSSMKPTKIGYKHGRPYYSVDFVDGTSDDYFIDFDKKEIEKCESLKEDKFIPQDKMSKKAQKEVTREEKIKAISSNPEARKQAKELTDKGELPFNSIVDFVYADFFGKDESLKEDKNELSIVGEFETGENFGQSAGTSKKNQAIFRAKALMKMKGLSRAKVVNTKGNVVWDSDTMLKEDKFVSRDKMSKKAQKELNDKKRNTWGNINPATRVQPNKKAYDRKRDKKELNESSDGMVDELTNLCRYAEFIGDNSVADEILSKWNGLDNVYDAIDLMSSSALSSAIKSARRKLFGPLHEGKILMNKKAYDRKRDKKVVDEDIENKDSEEYLGVDEVKRFVNAREKLLDISDSMTTDLRLGRISREDVLYYRNEIKEIYSFLNSLYFGR